MTELCDLCERCGDCMVPTLLEGISLASCENFVANEIDDDEDETEFLGNTDIPGAKYKIGDTLRIVEVFERNVSTEERLKLKGYEFKVGYIDQYSTGEFVYSTGDEAEHDIEYVFYEDEVELVKDKTPSLKETMRDIVDQIRNDAFEELDKCRSSIKGVIDNKAIPKKDKSEQSEDCHCYRLFRAYSELNEARDKIKELENQQIKVINALDADATLKYIEEHF